MKKRPSFSAKREVMSHCAGAVSHSLSVQSCWVPQPISAELLGHACDQPEDPRARGGCRVLICTDLQHKGLSLDFTKLLDYSFWFPV